MSLGLLRFTIIESSLDLSAHALPSRRCRLYAYLSPRSPSPAEKHKHDKDPIHRAHSKVHSDLNIPVMDGAKYARQKEPSPGVEEYVLLGFYFVARSTPNVSTSPLTPAYTYLVFQLSIHVSTVPFPASLSLASTTFPALATVSARER